MKKPKLIFTLSLGVLLSAGSVWAIVGFFFQHRIIYPTGYGPIDLAAGYIDGDDHLDLVTANRDANSLTVYFGKGDGSFMDGTDLYLPDLGTPPVGPISLTTVDYNKDKKTDIVVSLCENHCTQGSLFFLKGLGDGSFEDDFKFRAGKAPYNVTWGLINEDDIPDFVASDHPSGQIILLLSHSEGGYHDPQFFKTATKPISLQVGDLNGDAFDDVVVSCHADGGVNIFLSDGDTLQTQPFYKTGRLPYSIALGHLNSEEDEHIDLVVAHSTPEGSISYHLGTGTGRFEKKGERDVDAPLIFVKLADFDGDQRNDIVVMNDRMQYAEVFFGSDGDWFESQSYQFPSENKIYSAEVADFNRDGLLDLASVDFEKDELYIALAEPNY